MPQCDSHATFVARAYGIGIHVCIINSYHWLWWPTFMSLRWTTYSAVSAVSRTSDLKVAEVHWTGNSDSSTRHPVVRLHIYIYAYMQTLWRRRALRSLQLHPITVSFSTRAPWRMALPLASSAEQLRWVQHILQDSQLLHSVALSLEAHTAHTPDILQKIIQACAQQPPSDNGQNLEVLFDISIHRFSYQAGCSQ